MTVAEVEQAIHNLKAACFKAGITKLNRFYFQNNTVIFNVDYDGYLTRASLVDGELILEKSNKKKA